ncbi:MAG: FKBP-type peptidyl-prolyl cis-trans isomerase [Bacteroidetes bacterium]|nr:FKBP-type peptidyl-prolyl cis-trans isomerase [Bacteroidota bacterium]MBS1932099.1 FKBP-type peptidyl-prolyl cis-trans isomerase [Bacteroidota bacterium]
MKKNILILPLFSFATNLVLAQSGAKSKTKTNTTANPAAQKAILKTFQDSVSYACGMSFANYYKSQGVKDINTAYLSKAVNDVLKGKNVLFNDETANRIMNRYMFQLQAEKVKPAIDSGKKFLAANKTRPGVKTTASGLQYEVIKEGTGEIPAINDSVTCHYRGSFINGTEFESSYSSGRPITFSMHGVIRGWTEGLQLMTVGSIYKFFIPYTLGYGEFDYGAIPGGSTLIFEIELLAVKKNTAQ